MENLCKDIWEKTPSISCRYHLRTAIHKNGQDKRPIAAMNGEGSITLPLAVVVGVIVLVSIPCICCICAKKKKCKKAD